MCAAPIYSWSQIWIVVGFQIPVELRLKVVNWKVLNHIQLKIPNLDWKELLKLDLIEFLSLKRMDRVRTHLFTPNHPYLLCHILNNLNLPFFTLSTDFQQENVRILGFLGFAKFYFVFYQLCQKKFLSWVLFGFLSY